jgi:hypothetical protein
MSEKKRSKFFSLIFEEDKEEENKELQQKEPDTSAFTPTSQIPVSISSADDETVNKLWQVIIEENLPGPDYVELRNNISALFESGITTDEAQLFKSAYNVLKKSYPQLTKDIILKSIDTYKDIIEKERESGLAQFEELRKSRIDIKNADIENLKLKRTALEAEIKKKKEELSQIGIDLGKLEDEVEENTTEINSQVQKFESSIAKVKKTLDSDRDKINSLNI